MGDPADTIPTLTAEPTTYERAAYDLDVPDAVTVAKPDGELVDVPKDEAARLLSSGSVGLDGDRLYRMRSPDGDEGNVSPANVQEMLRRGGEFITPREQARAERVARERESLSGAALQATQQYFGGIGGLLEQEALSGGGVSSNLRRALTGEQVRALPEAYRSNILAEAHPTATTVGDVAGIASAMLPLGGGTVGGAVGRIAMAGEGALTRGLVTEGASAARQFAQRAAARGLAGAAEGATYGAQRALTEAAAGREDLTAESLLAAMGRDALIGGLGGAGIPAAGEIAAGSIQRMYQRVTGARLREGVAELAAKVYGGEGGAAPGAGPYSRAVKLATGSDEAAQITSRLTGLTPEGVEARRVIRRGDQVYDDGARAMRAAADNSEAAARPIMDIATGGGKADKMAELARGMDPEAAATDAALALGDAFQLFSEIRANTHITGYQLAAKRGLAIVKEAEDKILRAWESGSEDAAGEIFIAMDKAKRRIQKDIAHGQMGSEWFPLLDEMQNKFIKHLEDESLYGRAALSQQDINKAWHAYLTDADKFSSFFMTKLGQDGFRPTFTLDPAKAVSYLKNIGRAANDIQDEVLFARLKNQANLLDAIDKHYSLHDGLKAKVGLAKSETETVRKTLEKVRGEVETLNQYKTLDEITKGNAVASVVAGVAAGALGPAGVPVAVGIAAASNPSRVIRGMAQLEQTGFKVNEWIGKSAKKAVSAPSTGRAARAVEGATKALAKLERAGFRPSTRPARGAPALIKLYEARRAQLERDQQDPRRSTPHASLSRRAPKTAQMAAATMSRADAFLASKLPPRTERFNALQPSRVADLVSHSEAERFLRYARAVDAPLSIVEDLADGTVTRESVEAVRTVYPALFERIQVAVLEATQNAKAPIPYDKRLQIGVLLGVKTDPSLAPAMLADLQSTYMAMGQIQAPAPKSAPHTSEGMLTETQSVG